MSALILAVPSKGRLQENVEAFFAAAGLTLVKPRGARDYRGAVANLDGVEVAFVSAAEIAETMIPHVGAVDEHLGAYLTLTPDLMREHARRVDARIAAGEQLPLAGVVQNVGQPGNGYLGMVLLSGTAGAVTVTDLASGTILDYQQATGLVGVSVLYGRPIIAPGGIHVANPAGVVGSIRWA